MDGERLVSEIRGSAVQRDDGGEPLAQMVTPNEEEIVARRRQRVFDHDERRRLLARDEGLQHGDCGE